MVNIDRFSNISSNNGDTIKLKIICDNYDLKGDSYVEFKCSNGITKRITEFHDNFKSCFVYINSNENTKVGKFNYDVKVKLENGWQETVLDGEFNVKEVL